MAFHIIVEPQNIIKCKAVRGLSNKEMPLHGRQVKTNKSKDSIIWARLSLERLQKKCGIDATKDSPLGTVSSKASRDECAHMMLMRTCESILHDSSIARGSDARVVSSQHSPRNVVGEVPDVRKHNVGDLLTVGLPHFSVAE